MKLKKINFKNHYTIPTTPSVALLATSSHPIIDKEYWACRLELQRNSRARTRQRREAPTLVLRRERRRKNRNRRLRWQMDCTQPRKSVLPTFSLPPVREEGGGASTVEDAVLREDAEPSQIAEGENGHRIMAPLPLDLLRQQTMREQDRILHQIPKAGRIPCQNKGLDTISCLAFFVDNNSIQLEVARKT